MLPNPMQMSTSPNTQTQLWRGKNGAAAYGTKNTRPRIRNTTPIILASAALMSLSGSMNKNTIPITAVIR